MTASLTMLPWRLICWCICGVGAVSFPLHTQGRYVVDSAGKRVRLRCVNWSGADQKDGVMGGLQHQKVDNIVKWILKDGGFSCLRIPWSVEMVLNNPRVFNDSLLAANPEMNGATTLQILDSVIAACEKHGLMVILENHMSDGDWCCSFTDENGLWYNDRWPTSAWLSAHVHIAARYTSSQIVIGAGLRNELRAANISGKHTEPTWGTGVEATDWRLAAENCGRAVHAEAPHWLIVVDGLKYSTDFRDVAQHPVELPNLVYSAHDYAWSQHTTSYDELEALLDSQWGFLFKTAGAAFQAPVWVSEFGTAHDGKDMIGDTWWNQFLRYLSINDLDWAYWRVDGTESRGQTRKFGAEAAFGVLNTTWDGPAADGVLLKALQSLTPIEPFVDPNPTPTNIYF